MTNQELADITREIGEAFSLFASGPNWNLIIGFVLWGLAIAYYSHENTKLRWIFYLVGMFFMVSGAIRMWVKVEWVFFAPRMW